MADHRHDAPHGFVLLDTWHVELLGDGDLGSSVLDALGDATTSDLRRCLEQLVERFSQLGYRVGFRVSQ